MIPLTSCRVPRMLRRLIFFSNRYRFQFPFTSAGRNQTEFQLMVRLKMSCNFHATKSNPNVKCQLNGQRKLMIFTSNQSKLSCSRNYPNFPATRYESGSIVLEARLHPLCRQVVMSGRRKRKSKVWEYYKIKLLIDNRHP